MLQRTFAFIGIVFGLLFVFLNVSALPYSVGPAIAVVAAGLTAVALWGCFFPAAPAGPTRDDISVAALCAAVTVEVALITAGVIIFTHVLNLPHLLPPWIVLAVGAHFLSGRAFGARRFFILGMAMICLAAVGGLLTMTAGPIWASVTGVAAGYLVLSTVASHAFNPRHRAPGAARA